MSVQGLPFSELQLHTKKTVGRLKAAHGRLRLRRRDDEDLVLTTASRSDQEEAVLAAASRILVALARNGETPQPVLIHAVTEAFPWVRFFSPAERESFAIELTDTLRAADALHNPAPVVQVIAAWQHTAEAYADPEIASVLMADHDGDFGAVPNPSDAA